MINISFLSQIQEEIKPETEVSTERTVEGWLEKWNKSDIAFHQGEPNKYVSPQHVLLPPQYFVLIILSMFHEINVCLQHIKKIEEQRIFADDGSEMQLYSTTKTDGHMDISHF